MDDERLYLEYCQRAAALDLLHVCLFGEPDERGRSVCTAPTSVLIPASHGFPEEQFVIACGVTQWVTRHG